jgi:hypothetical protein
MRDPIPVSVAHTGNNTAAIAVTNEDDVLKFFPNQQIRNVGDMSVEVDLRRCQMAFLTKAGQGRYKYGIAPCAQFFAYPFLAPAAMPRTVNQDKGMAVSRCGLGVPGVVVNTPSASVAAPCAAVLREIIVESPSGILLCWKSCKDVRF